MIGPVGNLYSHVPSECCKHKAAIGCRRPKPRRNATHPLSVLSGLNSRLASSLPFPPAEASRSFSSEPELTSSPAGRMLAASTKVGSRLASPHASLSAGAAAAALASSPVLSSGMLPGAGFGETGSHHAADAPPPLPCSSSGDSR
jgi:hypothetical protein